LALSRIGETPLLIALATVKTGSLRHSAVLVLRRHRMKFSPFLRTRNEYIVNEPLAINDGLFIEPALPA